MSRFDNEYRGLSAGDRTAVNDLVGGIFRQETGFEGKINAAAQPALAAKWREIRDRVLANRQRFAKWLQGAVLDVADFTQAHAIFGTLGLVIRQTGSFPVPFIPRNGYGGGRGYGAPRPWVAAQYGVEKLLHGACDMIAAPGTPILAVADGIVMYNPKKFYPPDGPKVTQMTYEFAVRHADGSVARYCEIHSVALVKQGGSVRAGQVIGHIGDQPGTQWSASDDGYDMLHFEMYSGRASGDFNGYFDKNNPEKNGPYYRRSDLINPTDFLRRLEPTAIWPPHEKHYPTRQDSEGRTFLVRPI